MEFGLPQLIVLLVAAQRLIELVLARRNTARLLAAGAREEGAAHYPLFVALHAAWLVALFAAVPADAPVNGVLLALFVLLQAGRVWVIASLGRFWTTRVVTLPGAPLVRRGPYRLVRHPNYLIVAAELAVLPLAMGQVAIAVLFSLLNVPLTWHRIRVEERALAPRAAPAGPVSSAQSRSW
ncbi:isoprenylcysteine carboxyl methyltransferase family protein [Azospirillum halopraeferens]|uniref:isoprenylcysteine carboxyl methyltransferase family protein n=1 Tax=Azospirillum halopraeferens TaxID=34010 RepID=UPI0004056AB4|nr:isoprenylcysteine carboxylmethyltransferase family protein [Azospirillum halopraeferens]